MDEVLLRFLRGATTRAEDDQVTTWLQESPDNEAHQRALEEILSLARSQDAGVDPGKPPVATELIRRAERSRPPAARAHRLRPPAWAIAPLAVAATVAFVALGLLGYGRWGPDRDDTQLAAAELMTGAGESTTVRMSDGSVIRLGPESRLQVMPDGSGRQVVLVGRAFFAVTPDEKRPFSVHTPSGSMRVLGTRFQVESNVEDMRLVVVEGSVVLATSGSEVEVRTGEMTQVQSGRMGIVREAPGLAELSSEWMGQFLVFQRTPLTRVAKEIEEIYNVEVQILDVDLGEKTLTMWFSSRPLEDVLTVVCSVVDASCGIDGGVVSIAARRQ
ncbi:MAG: FecR domain-containing protein [Gemmatimonadota bacterium]